MRFSTSSKTITSILIVLSLGSFASTVIAAPTEQSCIACLERTTSALAPVCAHTSGSPIFNEDGTLVTTNLTTVQRQCLCQLSISSKVWMTDCSTEDTCGSQAANAISQIMADWKDATCTKGNEATNNKKVNAMLVGGLTTIAVAVASSLLL